MTKSKEEIQKIIKDIVKAKWQAERDGKLDTMLEAGLNYSITLYEEELTKMSRKKR